jgi:hypothetical protein
MDRDSDVADDVGADRATDVGADRAIDGESDNGTYGTSHLGANSIRGNNGANRSHIWAL